MERREFLKLSSLALLGLSSCNIRLFAPHQPLGLQLYSIRKELSENLEQSLEKVAALGYRNLEIYGYDGSIFGKPVKEFKTILNNTGLKVVSSHHITGIANKTEGSLKYGWEKAIENLHFLGAEYMVCAYLLENERTDEIYQSLPELFNKAGEQTKQANIQFAYHNHDFEFRKMGKQTVYDFILKNTNSNLVKMELDLYWITKAGYEPLDYFEKYPGRFPLWHVKDMAAGTGDFAAVGSGVIDFKKIFMKKDKAGLKHWLVEQDESKTDIFESLKTSRNYIRNHFDINDFDKKQP